MADDRRELLRIARATLREYLSSGFLPPGAPHRRALLEPRGAFVRIELAGALRGESGCSQDDTPLYLKVEQMTVAAATADSRFEPLRFEELPETRLEVAVFSPLQSASAQEVIPGTHGVVLTRGARRGLVLPDEGASREQLLDAACKKGGLPAGSWNEHSTSLQLFTVERFGEDG